MIGGVIRGVKSLFLHLLVFSIMFLSVTRSALACKGSQVLYEDNFSTLDPDWGEKSSNLSVNNGKLIIQPEVNKGYSVINQGSIFEDMDFCVKITLAKTEDLSGTSQGFLFWAKSYDEFYYLYVIDGKFSVARWVGGRWLYPVPSRENAAIKKGIAESNQLRVVTKGNQATVYINDTEVVTFKGQPPQGGSFIGMRGESPSNSQAVWEFSDLKVTKS